MAFGDSVCRLRFVMAHSSPKLVVHFHSSMGEGKGIADESWGLDNVRVFSQRFCAVIWKNGATGRRHLAKMVIFRS